MRDWDSVLEVTIMADETPNHQLNTYEQGDSNWEHSTDMETIEERLVIRDVEANLSNYTPHSGATFIATDSGAVFDGDGASWNGAERALKSVNGVQIARTPDHLQDAIDALPGDGGTVILSPGNYGDEDWTTGVTIPVLNGATLTIDGMGSSVQLDTWDGTDFFSLAEAANNNESGTLNIQNLSVNAFSVPAADLGNFATLPDIRRSVLNYFASGEFDIGTHIYASGNAGSCHGNETRIWHNKPDIGLKLGDENSALGVDRGEYRAQVNNIGDAGCEVAFGGWNELYIQPESARSDVSNGAIDGVRLRAKDGNMSGGHDNVVKIIHRVTGALDAVPIRCEADGNKIDTVGLGANAAIDKCALNVRAANINVPGFVTMTSGPLGDMTSLFNTGSTGGGNTPSENNFGQVLLNPGTTDGDISYLETKGQIIMSRACSQWARVNSSDSAGTLRFGFYADASNYAMFEADKAGSDWVVDVVSGGASVSGFPITATAQINDPTDLCIFSGINEDNEERQFWFVNGELVAETTTDLPSALGDGSVASRLEAESDGTSSKWTTVGYDIGIRDTND